MPLADILRTSASPVESRHWPEYVNRAGGAGKIQAPHWRAVKDAPEAVRGIPWNVDVWRVGGGRTALRYLAAYVAKSAFSESRLHGYDESGRIKQLRYKTHQTERPHLL